MRLKYQKGMTPERIAEHFIQFVRDNNLVIGAVNIYVQTYDAEMQPEKFRSDYYTCSPSDVLKQEYAEDTAQIRRKRIKKVVG